MLQCCQFLWKDFNSLASHLGGEEGGGEWGRGRGEESSSAGSNFYVTLYLCQYLFQCNFDNKKQNLVITIDYRIYKSYLSFCCKSVLGWHDLHRGDVFPVKLFNEGSRPGGRAGSWGRLPFHRQCSHSSRPLALVWWKVGAGVNFWSLRKARASITLVYKTRAGNAFCNQLWHVKKMYSSNLKSVIMLIGQ